MDQSNLPEYTQNPVYEELVSLCERCGIAVEYTPAAADRYARSDKLSWIQMGPDSQFRNAEHAAIVLGHELAHILEDQYHLRQEDLAKYEIAPYPSDDIEGLCDCWGVALYKLALLICDRESDDWWRRNLSATNTTAPL